MHVIGFVPQDPLSPHLEPPKVTRIQGRLEKTSLMRVWI